jgi:hypothetical protein
VTRDDLYVVMYNELGYDDPIVYTPSQCIELAKLQAQAVRPGFEYHDDEDALLNFMAVNWAWIVPRHPGVKLSDPKQVTGWDI